MAGGPEVAAGSITIYVHQVDLTFFLTVYGIGTECIRGIQLSGLQMCSRCRPNILIVIGLDGFMCNSIGYCPGNIRVGDVSTSKGAQSRALPPCLESFRYRGEVVLEELCVSVFPQLRPSPTNCEHKDELLLVFVICSIHL